MEQLQAQVNVLFWVNLALAIGIGFLVFCWICEALNKVLGVRGDRRKQRRAQRQADQQQDIQGAIQAAVAAQVAALQQGQST